MNLTKGKFRFIETENITTVTAEGGARAGELYYAMSTYKGIRTLLSSSEEYNYEVLNYNRKGTSGEIILPSRGIEVITPNDALQVVDFGGLKALYHCMVVSMGEDGFADFINFYDEETYMKLLDNSTKNVYANYTISPLKVTTKGTEEEEKENETTSSTNNPFKDANVENEELRNLVLKMQKENKSLHNEIAYLKLVNDSLMSKKEEAEQTKDEQDLIGVPKVAYVEPKHSSDTALIIGVLVITSILSIAIGMLLMMIM